MMSLRLIESCSPPDAPTALVPVLPHRGLIEPSLDQIVSTVARRGDRNSPPVRNALFTAFHPRLHRILTRLWYRNISEFGCELDDLEQELFPIFVVLLERWSGNGSFSAYIHGACPWRIYDSARRLAPRDWSLDGRTVAASKCDGDYLDAESTMLLEELANRLSPFDRTLLLWHVRDERSLSDIARSLGLSQRTMRRAWLRLQRQLQRELMA